MPRRGVHVDGHERTGPAVLVGRRHPRVPPPVRGQGAVRAGARGSRRGPGGATGHRDRRLRARRPPIRHAGASRLPAARVRGHRGARDRANVHDRDLVSHETYFAHRALTWGTRFVPFRSAGIWRGAMGNGGTLTFHAATRLALELPSGDAGPAIRSSTSSRLRPNSTEPVAVATAVWRMVYGGDEAIERGFEDPSREGAVNFLVALVQDVEGRLLEGGANDPEALVEQIADQAVLAWSADRGLLCEQLGIQVPPDGLAGERLFSLARELCAAIAANVMPILKVSQPLTRAETFGRARELKDLAPIGRVSTYQAAPVAEPEAAPMAAEETAR